MIATSSPTGSPPAEADIIEGLRDPQRRERAFRGLVVQYGPVLYRHLLRMIQQRTEVDDVLQNTFVKAYQNLDRFRGDSKLLTWLYRIATNEALSHLRSRKRYQNRVQTVEDLTPYAATLQAESFFDGDDAQAALAAAIGQLAEKQRAVFCLRYYDEMAYREISKITGTTVGGLKATYHQATKKIELLLKAHVNGR